MNLSEEEEIKKEFQLERVILFSDAVFAILITIMVIDLKLPETIREASSSEVAAAFGNLYVKFLGYGLTFFLVSVFWIQHIKIFSFLKDYNKTILILNLVFLFCLSLFPMAITLITGAVHLHGPEYAWGINIYIGVVLSTNFSQVLITRYLIKNKTTYCVATNKMEDQLKWKSARINMYVAPVMVAVLIVLNLLGVNSQYLPLVVGIYGASIGFLNRRYYPDAKREPFLKQLFSRRKKKPRKLKTPPGESV
jgi:uncharacterized membrane protein